MGTVLGVLGARDWLGMRDYYSFVRAVRDGCLKQKVEQPNAESLPSTSKNHFVAVLHFRIFFVAVIPVLASSPLPLQCTSFLSLLFQYQHPDQHRRSSCFQHLYTNILPPQSLYYYVM